MQRVFTSLFSTLSLAILSCLIPLAAKAQVTPDGTTSTTVNQNGNNYTVEQGDRIGGNLFHSFEQFSVPTSGSAGFNNAADVANIFSRVTGGDISNIDGLLSASGAANLYLINPNGIIFGENARLDLGGSFFASTADSLLFDNNAEFSAVDPQAPPLLEVSIPIGLSFRDNPGNIVNRSSAQNAEGDFVGLEVLSGSTLALVGGNINFESGIAFARGGNIELGGLSEAGIVAIEEDGGLIFSKDIAKANVSLSNFADVDVQSTGGGNITINAQNLSLESGELGRSFIRAGISSESNSAEAQAGDIIINVAENIALDNSQIINDVSSGGVGNSGDITITTSSLEVINGGEVSATTFGRGNAGSVGIEAIKNVIVDGQANIVSSINSQVEEGAEGNARGVNISATDVSLTNGGKISSDTDGQGDAGAITINAENNITLDDISENIAGSKNFIGIASGITSSSRLEAVGNAGEIAISTTNLIIDNAGQISSISGGEGNGGNINIDAREKIVISGETARGASSFIASEAIFTAVGNGGDINITTARLSLADGGSINAENSGEGNGGNISIIATEFVDVDGKDSGLGFPSRIVSSSVGSSSVNSGNISISSANLTLTNGGIIDTATTGTGNAGDINVSALKSIFISGIIERNSSGISSSATFGSGDGGNINVVADQIIIEDEGIIEASNFDNLGLTEPGTGEPGNIVIQASSLDLDRGSISAATQSPVGNGANITLASDNLTLQDNSLISARAFENASGGNVTINADEGFILAFPNGNNDIVANAQQGNGGKIDIDTQAIFGLEERSSTPPNQTNDIDASSEFGLQGDFSLNTPDFDPTSGLIELPASVGDASDQISQNPCQQGVGSEFIVTGKGGLPRNPADSLGSNEVQVGLVEPLSRQEGETVSASKQLSKDRVSEAVPAMGWVFNDKGEVTLTAYSNTDTEKERSTREISHNCSISQSSANN